jgi:hypothetical protein
MPPGAPGGEHVARLGLVLVRATARRRWLVPLGAPGGRCVARRTPGACASTGRGTRASSAPLAVQAREHRVRRQVQREVAAEQDAGCLPGRQPEVPVGQDVVAGRRDLAREARAERLRDQRGARQRLPRAPARTVRWGMRSDTFGCHFPSDSEAVHGARPQRASPPALAPALTRKEAGCRARLVPAQDVSAPGAGRPRTRRACPPPRSRAGGTRGRPAPRAPGPAASTCGGAACIGSLRL